MKLPTQPHQKRGVALLTVLVILTILVVFATAFIQTVRIENETTANYKYGVMVQDTARVGVESLREEFTSLLNGHDGIPFTGDEIRPYVSLIDTWAIGKADVIEYSDPRTIYDLRQWLFNTALLQSDPNAVLIHNGAIWEVRPRTPRAGLRESNPFRYLARRGIDEDPPGDLSGDGQPGIGGIDDDLDGLTDPPGRPPSEGGADDDDEDGLRDEDGVEIRRFFLGESADQGGRIDSLGMGFDNDGDFNGIEPAAGRVHLGIAGNRNRVPHPPPSPSGNSLHVYHSGIHPSELDLETFMSALVGIRGGRGTNLAQRIVEFRSGISRGPGIGGADEKSRRETDGALVGNTDPEILGPLLLDRDLIEGDGVDNDGDGLTDEADELLAGFLDLTANIPTDLIDNRGNRATLLTNNVDDGGIPGVVDDIFEIDDANILDNPGVDDLRETRPSSPFGDDAPPRSRYVIQLIEGMSDLLNPADEQSPTVYDFIQRFITVVSTTQRLQQESEADIVANRVKINPNLVLKQTPTLSRKPLNFLLPLAGLDNDGDWGSNTRIYNSAVAGATIRDDSNQNHIPDGNWDTVAETTSGFDPVTGRDNRDFIDNDYDGRVDDDGDANKLGIYYDPERHVNEDRPTYTGILNEEREDGEDNDRERLLKLIERGVFDVNSGALAGSYRAPLVLPLWEDRIDNNSNSVRWMSDGIDNDGDGLTDETWWDEVQAGVPPFLARDEGVDEPGEWYIYSWDDDVFEANHDNIDNDNDGLTDLREGDLDEEGLTIERHGERFVFRHDEDPIDLQFVANLADAMDYSTDLRLADGASKFTIENASRGYAVEAFGNEALRITEVLARPVIRLQAEHADLFPTSGNWLGPDDHGLTDRAANYHFVNTNSGVDTGEWTWNEPIPKGRYYVLLYSFNNGDYSGPGETNNRYNLDDVTANVVSDAGTFAVDRNSSDHYNSETFAEKLFPTIPSVRSWLRTSGRPHVVFTDEPVEIEGPLTVEITAFNVDSNAPLSFDYVELYAPDAQYLEMVNFGERPLDLAGWEIRQGSETYRLKSEDPIPVLPGQFVLVYPEDEAKDENVGPSGITDLRPKTYENDPGPEPLILAAEDFVDESTLTFKLTSSLEDILFASSTARAVEVWAPKLDLEALELLQQGSTPDLESASRVLVDSFYYNGSSDDCSVLQVFHRQDKMVFFAQRRGDPTASLLRHDTSLLDASITIERYVHAPVRFLAEDAVVTLDSDEEITTAEVEEGALFKPNFVLGRSLAPGERGTEDERTEYGEVIFGLTEREQEAFDSGNYFSDDNTVTFHWPGVLNHFRAPYTSADTANVPGVVDGLPVLYVRGYGVPNTPLGVFDRDVSPDGVDERLMWHGDLLFVFDPNEDLEEYEDVINIERDSIRITLRVPETADIPVAATTLGAVTIPSATFAFAYLEIGAGFPETKGYMACDPGRDYHFYSDPDLTVNADARYLFMQRRRLNDPNLPPEAVSERSLRFREGPLANCSPYMAGAFGRNIEKYSMGRGVFSGPTPRELSQIATWMEFHSDPVVDGLININVADQKVLCALPFFPPEAAPQVFSSVLNRLRVAALMSQVLVMGRSQRGIDGEIGNPAGDGDGDGRINLDDYGYVDASGNPLTDRYAPSWDALLSGPNGFGVFDFDDNGDGVIDDPGEYRSPGSDDGPYASVGQAAIPMMHPMVLQELRKLNPQIGGSGLKPEGTIGLFDDSDVAMMIGRIMNLVTVHANEFIVISRGRVIDTEVTVQDQDLNNVLAEQRLEEDLSR